MKFRLIQRMLAYTHRPTPKPPTHPPQPNQKQNVPAMIRSVKTIWGVLITLHKVVDTALLTKSNAGPAKDTGNHPDSVVLVASSTANASAPCGKERANCAPAPRVRMRKFRLLSSACCLGNVGGWVGGWGRWVGGWVGRWYVHCPWFAARS